MPSRRVIGITNVVGRMEEMLDMLRIMKIQLDVVEEDMKRGLNHRHEEESDDEELGVQTPGLHEKALEEEESDQIKMLKAISKIGNVVTFSHIALLQMGTPYFLGPFGLLVLVFGVFWWQSCQSLYFASVRGSN